MFCTHYHNFLRLKKDVASNFAPGSGLDIMGLARTRTAPMLFGKKVDGKNGSVPDRSNDRMGMLPQSRARTSQPRGGLAPPGFGGATTSNPFMLSTDLFARSSS